VNPVRRVRVGSARCSRASASCCGPIQSWDRERLYELVETIEVRALATNDPPLPLSLEEIQARDERWVEERHTDSAWFAIDVDEELVGMCGLHAIGHYHQRAEVGIRIGQPHWRLGFGQDAVRTLVDYGFRHPTGRPGSSRRGGSGTTPGTTARGTTTSSSACSATSGSPPPREREPAVRPSTACHAPDLLTQERVKGFTTSSEDGAVKGLTRFSGRCPRGRQPVDARCANPQSSSA
jgi:RimJ/RimL family protein N-acetyltransferase